MPNYSKVSTLDLSVTDLLDCLFIHISMVDTIQGTSFEVPRYSRILLLETPFFPLES